MKLTVDRIEGEIVVCEDENKEILELHAIQFVEIPKDGDIVELNDEGLYQINVEESQSRKNDMENRFKNLFK